MQEFTHLPIEHQIHIVKHYIENNENHIRHYSRNPIQLDELRYKIQTQALQDHNKELHKLLEKLNKQLNNQ